MRSIYSPTGRAAEFCKLALNLFDGCSHGCTYCYVPTVLHKTREEFLDARPRPGIIEALEADKRRGNGEQVHLCFTSDPYQPIEKQYGITRRAIEILHQHGYGVRILTKAGSLAQRDFDLLGPGDAFGVTLTLLDFEESKQWEPHAALPIWRIDNLHEAYDRGIPTWVSLEPVIHSEVTLEIIRQTHEFVDEFKVGKMNYHPVAVDWWRFAHDVVSLLESLGCKYYIKEDLRRYL